VRGKHPFACCNKIKFSKVSERGSSELISVDGIFSITGFEVFGDTSSLRFKKITEFGSNKFSY